MQFIKEAFSEANIEMVHRAIIKGEDLVKVVKEMREEGKFSSEEEQESSEEELDEYGEDDEEEEEEEEKSPTR